MTTKAARDFSTESRDKMATSGMAMADGSYPIPDRDALRRAIASFGRAKDPEAVKRHIIARARALGCLDMLPADWNVSKGKAAFDLKAEPFTARKLGQWLDGQIGRRVLVLPFGGPLPGGKAGLDLDGEYFDETTDHIGDIPALAATRWRFMDWHHDDAGVPGKTSGGPALSMKGLLIGEVELDEDPDEFGLWAQWWIKQGQSRQALIGAKRVAALEEMGQPIFGSSQAVYKRKADDGHIEVWPLFRHTATTSPQNTFAVIPALKGVLDGLTPDSLSSDAMSALLVGLTHLEPELRRTFPDAEADPFRDEGGDAASKAGRVLARAKEQRLRDAIDAAVSRLVAELDDLVGAEPPDSSSLEIP